MQKVESYLQEHREQFVDELCAYLRFPSVSAQPKHQPDVLACAQWLLEHCKAIGLEARLAPTDGNPVLLATTRRGARSRRPHFVIYGHYDVQPPDPLDLWKSDPFEPRREGGSLYARGASDNKGQNFAHLKAVEAYLKTGTPLPCDLTFLIEGEEEIGSGNLAPFLRAHQDELACEAVVISDTGMPDLKHPALSYGLRGIVALEVRMAGPNRDLHSGLFGGSVDNPAMALCQMLGSLRDSRGRVSVPGFYKDVRALSAFERKQMARLPFSSTQYRRSLGVPELFGEAGYSPIEQRSARPTLEINGLTSGYQGEGSKTIVPAWASAKLTMRLVPDQKPEKVQRLVMRHLQKICPGSVKISFGPGHGGDPYLVSPTGRLAQGALRALRSAFGHEPVLMREGGSIPIVQDFKKILGVDTILLGLALPDDNLHSPNEKFSLESFWRGTRMSCHLWQELVKQ